MLEMNAIWDVKLKELGGIKFGVKGADSLAVMKSHSFQQDRCRSTRRGRGAWPDKRLQGLQNFSV